jgi:hypothetical protein
VIKSDIGVNKPHIEEFQEPTNLQLYHDLQDDNVTLSCQVEKLSTIPLFSRISGARYSGVPQNVFVPKIIALPHVRQQ